LILALVWRVVRSLDRFKEIEHGGDDPEPTERVL